jgi:RNA polymerase sigma-70 factor (ECF subfamily)
MTDPELVSFVEIMHPRLVGGLSLYCGDSAMAEELAQETLVRVWERWPKVSTMSSPAGWAWTVALNLARSRYRRRAAERRALDRLRPADQQRDPDAADALAVRQLVAALPDRQRRALVLRYFADLSVRDAAASMGCAEGTVKALTSQAIATLRREIGVGLTEEVADRA